MPTPVSHQAAGAPAAAAPKAPLPIGMPRPAAPKIAPAPSPAQPQAAPPPNEGGAQAADQEAPPSGDEPPLPAAGDGPSPTPATASAPTTPTDAEEKSRATGPKTSFGKATSSMNALKHGIYASSILLPGESEDEFFALRDKLMRAFGPSDEMEKLMVENIVNAAWLARRLQFIVAVNMRSMMQENGAQSAASIEEDPWGCLADNLGHDLSGAKISEKLSEFGIRRTRELDRAIEALQKYRIQKLKIRRAEIELAFLTAPPAS